MNEDTSTFDAQAYTSQDISISPLVHFCSLCNKPFTTGCARDRHFRYCASRTRSRPRSCQACKVAKTKCNFETPCLRCVKKETQCIYHDPWKASAWATDDQAKTSTLPRKRARSSHGSSDVLLGYEASLEANEDILPPVNFTPEQGSEMGGVRFPSLEVDIQEPESISTRTFDNLFHLDDFAQGRQPFSTDFTLALTENSASRLEDWCAWTRHGITLAVVTEGSQARPPSLLHIARPRDKRSNAECNADLIIQSWRAFPTMMLRKETLPWFIHPYSGQSSSPYSESGALPEAISTCMGIAQMFAPRTPETKSFLWRTIEAEYRRFVTDIHSMSQYDALAATQACMMYLIMCIIDHSPENERHGETLLRVLYDLCMHFKVLCGGSLNESEISVPSFSWEDWIFAESRRRLASLWLLVGCVICVKGSIPCDPSESYRQIPLPAPKSLWEASSQQAWELEYEASRMLHLSGLVTMGDLVDLQRADYTPSNARKLDVWNAGVDNLGSLLNLVGSMV